MKRTMHTRQDSTDDDDDTLCVRFLGDDDALETIRSIEEVPPTLSVGHRLAQMPTVGRRRAKFCVATTPSSTSCLSPASHPDSEPECEPCGSSSELHQLDSAQLEVGDGVRGSAMFGFQRSRRRQHLRRLAEQLAAQSPLRSAEVATPPVTPKRGASGQRATAGSGRGGTRRARAAAADNGDHDEKPEPPGTPAPKPEPETPRRRTKQQSAATPRTPKVSAVTAGAGKGSTPRSSAVSAAVQATPQGVRRQVRQRLTKLRQEDIAAALSDDDDDSDVSPLEDSDEDREYGPQQGQDEEDEEEEESGDESDTVERSEKKAPAKVSAVRGRGGPRTRPDVTGVPADSEAYFELHSSAGVTSSHTLARLSEPRLSSAALRSALGDRPADHAAERAALLADLESGFPRWLAALAAGFSVLLHGLGSKRLLLDRLRLAHLGRQLHVVVNGFHPSVTPRALLQTLVEDLLELTAPPGKLDAQADAVVGRFSGPGAERLYLLVNSIDGPMMRGERMQLLLARLAQAERVHLVATVDHINAPLIWDQHKLAQFNFLWFDATTLLPYAEETSYENSLLVRQTAELALSSLRHVFKSLTPNARGIFVLLAKHQVECAGDRAFEGLTLSDLYQRCREAFLVSSQVALRAQLTEFKDHKLIRSRQSHDGAEYLTVPLETGLISEFLADCDTS